MELPAGDRARLDAVDLCIASLSQILRTNESDSLHFSVAYAPKNTIPCFCGFMRRYCSVRIVWVYASLRSYKPYLSTKVIH